MKPRRGDTGISILVGLLLLLGGYFWGRHALSPVLQKAEDFIVFAQDWAENAEDLMKDANILKAREYAVSIREISATLDEKFDVFNRLLESGEVRELIKTEKISELEKLVGEGKAVCDWVAENLSDEKIAEAEMKLRDLRGEIQEAKVKLERLREILKKIQLFLLIRGDRGNE